MEIDSDYSFASHKPLIGGLLVRVKRLLFRWLVQGTMAPIFARQREFNAHLVRFCNELCHFSDRLNERIKLIEKEVKSHGTFMKQLTDVADRLESSISLWEPNQIALQKELERFTGFQTLILKRLEELRQELSLQRGELSLLGSSLQREPSEIIAEKKSLPAQPDFIKEDDYLKFEKTFRGPSEVIKKRQSVYVQYFKGKKRVLDLGCGRGEFLSLLKENSIGGYGVDYNGLMVAHCRRQGLEVVQGDALGHLEKLPDSSLDGLFAAQFIEHLPPDRIPNFISLCYRKLQPASYLVIETINPKSLHALINHFYLDLTHAKPLLPLTLKFLLEVAGFETV
ncbi:MAG: class I SAM-dependent methyltransferase, partial [Acidobacteriota bacterium]